MSCRTASSSGTGIRTRLRARSPRKRWCAFLWFLHVLLMMCDTPRLIHLTAFHTEGRLADSRRRHDRLCRDRSSARKDALDQARTGRNRLGTRLDQHRPEGILDWLGQPVAQDFDRDRVSPSDLITPFRVILGRPLETDRDRNPPAAISSVPAHSCSPSPRPIRSMPQAGSPQLGSKTSPGSKSPRGNSSQRGASDAPRARMSGFALAS